MKISANEISRWGMRMYTELMGSVVLTSSDDELNMHELVAAPPCPCWVRVEKPTDDKTKNTRGLKKAKICPIPILFLMLGEYSRRKG